MGLVRNKRNGITVMILAGILIMGAISNDTVTSMAEERSSFYNSCAAYAAEDGLHCVSIHDGKDELAVKGLDISNPLFSADGNIIVFKQENDLLAYDRITGKTKALLTEVNSYCAGPENGFYATGNSVGIMLINPLSMEKKEIKAYDERRNYDNLRLSPDYKYLAFDAQIREENTYYGEGMWLYDTETKHLEQIMEGTRNTEHTIGNNPKPAKWSPDSKKLFFWNVPGSASLAADGVGAGVYDVERKEIILETGSLAYDENITFSNSNAFAMISGGGRMMFEDKWITLFDLEQKSFNKEIETPDMVPTTPYYSADGEALIFAASPRVEGSNDFAEEIASISKRQIYLYKEGKIAPLTKEEEYRSEWPILLKNQQHIIFARQNKAGEYSLWMMHLDGANQNQLALWKYSDPGDSRGLDFYGRIDWSTMIAVYDDTRYQDEGLR